MLTGPKDEEEENKKKNLLFNVIISNDVDQWSESKHPTTQAVHSCQTNTSQENRSKCKLLIKGK
jgi:hypothetical protein